MSNSDEPKRLPIPDVLSQETVYRGFFDLRIDLLSLSHGLKRPYTVLEAGFDAAVIIAETKEGEIVVNHEYRHPTGFWLLSCPGGKIDGTESPIEAAKRELLEETGYTSHEFITMGSLYPFPALCNQKIHFILAKNAYFLRDPQREPFELIHTSIKRKEEIFKEITSGNPVDGVLCTALLLRGLI